MPHGSCSIIGGFEADYVPWISAGGSGAKGNAFARALCSMFFAPPAAPMFGDHLEARVRCRTRACPHSRAAASPTPRRCYSSPEFNLYANIRPGRTLLPAAPKRRRVIVVREEAFGVFTRARNRIPPRSRSLRLSIRHGDFCICEIDPQDLALCVRDPPTRAANGSSPASFELTGRHSAAGASRWWTKPTCSRATGGLATGSPAPSRKRYPPDRVREALCIDTACMNLVRKPGRFDVIVAENLFW